jgi:hypothetical protein
MRALRDLIVACECTFGADHGEQAILRRAQDAFTALRAEFGDTRPAEEIAEGEMHEPRGMREALELAAGALGTVEHAFLPQKVRFTGKWSHYGTRSISDVLDRTDAALASVGGA